MKKSNIEDLRPEQKTKVGYNDAVKGKSFYHENDEHYMCGYHEGLQALSHWSSGDLKHFEELFPEFKKRSNNVK